MNSLSKAIEKVSMETETENGAKAFNKLTGELSANLTLFGLIGALRPRTETDITNMFSEAFNENPKLATKMLFYAGDIRKGLGERRTFNICLKWMAMNHPDVVRKNMIYIPVFNRFDSWYTLIDTPVEKDMWIHMKTIYTSDYLSLTHGGGNITLLAKWMKSINTSSKESRELGYKTMKALQFKSPKDYRKTLSKLRGRLRVVEKTMSAGRWNGIEYSQVPSLAMKNYASAFGRHDHERFSEYIESLQKGEEKINASVLFPYDVVKPLTDAYEHSWGDQLGKFVNIKGDERIIEEQWKALPNYIREDDTNILCMIDVSPSMYGRPIASAIGLGLYFAERNKGAFHNQYMTFSHEPQFISVNDNMTLQYKVNKTLSEGVGYSTDLQSAFELLLNTALKNEIPQEEMPKALIILSDSEVDSLKDLDELDFVKAMKKMYSSKGYKMPKLVIFQLESRQNIFLSQSEDVLWVSGQSASTFKSIINNIEGTSEELMFDTLMSERYKEITI